MVVDTGQVKVSAVSCLLFYPRMKVFHLNTILESHISSEQIEAVSLSRVWPRWCVSTLLSASCLETFKI